MRTALVLAAALYSSVAIAEVVRPPMLIVTEPPELTILSKEARYRVWGRVDPKNPLSPQGAINISCEKTEISILSSTDGLNTPQKSLELKFPSAEGKFLTSEGGSFNHHEALKKTSYHNTLDYSLNGKSYIQYLRDSEFSKGHLVQMYLHKPVAPAARPELILHFYFQENEKSGKREIERSFDLFYSYCTQVLNG